MTPPPGTRLPVRCAFGHQHLATVLNVRPGPDGRPAVSLLVEGGCVGLLYGIVMEKETIATKERE